MTENISIHALRGEGDFIKLFKITRICIISIHALRGEGDFSKHIKSKSKTYFNPRPPWGGRRQKLEVSPPPHHFNPRPPWGGRPPRSVELNFALAFQSTPSVGRATSRFTGIRNLQKFQSTPSVGRATRSLFKYLIYLVISIHALRGEGDPAEIIQNK